MEAIKNELMENEQVMNETEEVGEGRTGTGLSVLVGVGIAAVAAGAGYALNRFVVKPIRTKIKAKKEAKRAAEADVVIDVIE